MVKRRGYLIEDKPGEYRVGARDPSPDPADMYPYVGPCAHVYGDGDWVYVSTDAYEGTAMLNREALPFLIKALRKLEAHLVAGADLQKSPVQT